MKKSFHAKAGGGAQRPRRILRIKEPVAATHDEQLGTCANSDIWNDRAGGRSPDAKDHGCLVLLDQVASLLKRARRTVSMVEANEPDLTSVDSAFNVLHEEVGLSHLGADR
jgi:hypothetical protein